MKSKWADDEEDAAQRKREKEEKKRAKAEKHRKIEEEQLRKQQEGLATSVETAQIQDNERPAKRRRLSSEGANTADHIDSRATPLLRFDTPGWSPSRTVADFETLNPIEEGTYGYVSRARNKRTGEIVALKKMKLEHASSYGIPVTALREIQTLQRARHRNIISLHEVITSDDTTTAAVPDIHLVMEFAAHDLKSLLEDMPEPFLPSEIKTLMLQLTSALSFLHSHWILHRDLKTSNILLTSTGTLKLADFGMARFTSAPPPPNLTALVVTLWYRAPELLLGAKEYDFAVDMWSLGCVFGELMSKDPLLQGRNEVDQLSKIFELCGLPSDATWPGFRRLPNAKTLKLPSRPDPGAEKGKLAGMFSYLTRAGHGLLRGLLSLNPESRPSADDVLEHRYFEEDPRPKKEEMFPSFPSKAGLEKRRKRETPNAPIRGEEGKVDFSSLFSARQDEAGGGGFQLKMR